MMFLFFQAEDGIRDLSLDSVLLCCFFFQAEDGIRDLTVTGVQTCALPIWIRIGEKEISDGDLKDVFDHVKAATATCKDLLYPPTYFEIVTAMAFLYFRDRDRKSVV